MRRILTLTFGDGKMTAFAVFRVEPVEEDGQYFQSLGIVFAESAESALVLAKAKFADVCQHPAVEPI